MNANRPITALAAWLLTACLAGCAGASEGTPTPLSTTAAPSATPPASAVATPTVTVGPSATPAETVSPAPAPTRPPTATRIVIPAFGIDLPVINGDTDVPGNPSGFPPCNVALYLPYYEQPSQDGTTYIYAHAREGMFLPLLEASRQADDSALLGTEVLVYTAAALAYRYAIGTVQRHATDFSLANSVAPGERQLIIQTSEGPDASHPKLVLAAAPIGMADADPAEATPSADPRPCG